MNQRPKENENHKIHGKKSFHRKKIFMTLHLATVLAMTPSISEKWKSITGLYQNQKNFWALEDIINRVKTQFKEWEEIFTDHISDQGLITRKYKELIKLNNKNTQRAQLWNGQGIWKNIFPKKN